MIVEHIANYAYNLLVFVLATAMAGGLIWSVLFIASFIL